MQGPVSVFTATKTFNLGANQQQSFFKSWIYFAINFEYLPIPTLTRFNKVDIYWLCLYENMLLETNTNLAALFLNWIAAYHIVQYLFFSLCAMTRCVANAPDCVGNSSMNFHHHFYLETLKTSILQPYSMAKTGVIGQFTSMHIKPYDKTVISMNPMVKCLLNRHFYIIHEKFDNVASSISFWNTNLMKSVQNDWIQRINGNATIKSKISQLQFNTQCSTQFKKQIQTNQESDE